MFYDSTDIHNTPLVLRQRLALDGGAAGDLLGGVAASAAASLLGPMGSVLEMRFGRIVSFSEVCEKNEKLDLRPSKIQLTAWLFDDELDPFGPESNETIGQKLATFQAFFFMGKTYEIIHPYAQSIDLLGVTIDSRALDFHGDKVVVTLKMTASDSLTERIKNISAGLSAAKTMASAAVAQMLASQAEEQVYG
ncbi:MAG: hypothetical protein A2508_02570 [Candidatus Lambdaproteobacteria bacterium RIFOXYD12_FULL_49_8]|uniref:Uncharacterized protein n=1 Tax=Candidatus Lambdaproteobacteria bacterium RIFOXYD2_FULL_50_16 TaxID=1817772 RepID=A0A1F6G8B3_9PROT|nr:MAG: hypothetical protein A2527_00540 [Candidatus Lambdaproteobacteria bacterium RIFOXYD2_FULL_50_16]OGG98269.1 MAG: hypothetical protein A2508_02570 [Candidatus Lambdaproteobacteria bacterium RIFOXYD12_FULL_49_8]